MHTTRAMPLMAAIRPLVVVLAFRRNDDEPENTRDDNEKESCGAYTFRYGKGEEPHDIKGGDHANQDNHGSA